MKSKSKFRLHVWLFAIVIFVFSFGIRFYKLSETPLYPDEITWMVRGRETALAIRTLNFDFFDSAWWEVKEDTEAIALPLAVFTGFPQIYLAKDASVLSFNLFNDYLVGRVAVIFLVSLFLSFTYLIVDQFFSHKVALFTSLLLSIDPIFLFNSKLIMNDSLLTIFITVSLLSYLVIKNNKIAIIFSSLFLALGFLTKPTALLIILIFGFQILLNIRNWKKELIKFISVGLITFLFISILWPSSWNNLFLAIPEYLVKQGEFAKEGINNYFLGSLTTNPPFYYYFFEVLVRVPVIILLGFSGFIIWFVASFKKNKNNVLYKINCSFLLFIAIYLLVMGLSAKKLGIRYVLPVFPFLYIFFVQAFVMVLERFKSTPWKAMFCLILICFSFLNLAKYFPYYDFYYNFLVGRGNSVRNLDLVGLCTGSKAGVDYVLTNYPQVKQIAAIGCGRATIPYYYPNNFTYDWKNEKIVVVEAYYIQLNKDPELSRYYFNNPPTKVISTNGIDLAYVWIR